MQRWIRRLLYRATLVCFSYLILRYLQFGHRHRYCFRLLLLLIHKLCFHLHATSLRNYSGVVDVRCTSVPPPNSDPRSLSDTPSVSSSRAANAFGADLLTSHSF
ncbi:hypothetical protein BKA93DRAFT_813510 [Sparassis latifolia]